MKPLRIYLPLSNAAIRGSIFCLGILLTALDSALAAQPSWTPVGPDGGDARALAAVPGEPSHLYLGTTTSLIYESTDEGASWHRLAKLDSTSDLVIDHILADPGNPAVLYAAAW